MKRLFAALIAVFAVPAMLDTSHAQRLPAEVSVWYNDGWDDESHARYLDFHHMISEVSPFWYNLSDGKLDDGSVHERAYAYSAQKVQEVHSHGDLVIPSVADTETGQIDRILANPVAAAALLDNLVRLVLSRNFDGICLDFERGSTTSRTAFTVFVGELARRLHKHKKTLQVVVKAATTAKEEQREMFDFAGLAQTGVDRIKVMAYDHNFDRGRDIPGSISPIPWIRMLVDYMVKERKIAANRIQLAIHTYGWIWKQLGPDRWELQLPFAIYAELLKKVKTAGIG